MARPKAGPPSAPPYRAEPPPLARPLDQPRMQGPEPSRMTSEVVVQPAASPAPTLRDRAEEIRRQLAQAFQAAVEQVAPPEPPRVQARPQRLPEEKRPVQPPMMQQRRQPAPGPRGEQAPAGRSRVQQLFPGMAAVRRGIIMAEVLGPPKAMQ